MENGHLKSTISIKMDRKVIRKPRGRKIRAPLAAAAGVCAAAGHRKRPRAAVRIPLRPRAVSRIGIAPAGSPRSKKSPKLGTRATRTGVTVLCTCTVTVDCGRKHGGDDNHGGGGGDCVYMVMVLFPPSVTGLYARITLQR